MADSIRVGVELGGWLTSSPTFIGIESGKYTILRSLTPDLWESCTLGTTVVEAEAGG